MPTLKRTLSTLLLGLLVACGQPQDAATADAAPPMAEMARNAAPDSMSYEMAAPLAPAKPAPLMPESIQGRGSSAAGVMQRLIIRNASLTLVVKDAEAELGPLTEIARRYGGFVSQSGFSRDDLGTASGTVQLRIEAAQLDAALVAIRARAIEVSDFNLSSDDVTGQVVDVEARLRNLQSAEQQLHDIMRRAWKTQDVMAVFGQLTQTRGEIEQAQAQLKYLRESAALSSVTVSLQPDVQGAPVQLAGWQPTGTAKRAVETVVQGLQAFADLLIWASIVLAPLLLLVLLPLVWLARRGLRGRAARRS